MIRSYFRPSVCTLVTTALSQWAIQRPELNKTHLKEMALVSAAFTVSQIASAELGKFIADKTDSKSLTRGLVYVSSTFGFTYLIKRCFNLPPKMSYVLGIVSMITFINTIKPANIS